MAERRKDTRSRAESAFKAAQKAEREKDKSAAMVEYEADTRAVRDRSARLRELRLARDEAEAKEEAEKPKVVKKKRPPKR